MILNATAITSSDLAILSKVLVPIAGDKTQRGFARHRNMMRPTGTQDWKLMPAAIRMHGATCANSIVMVTNIDV